MNLNGYTKPLSLIAVIAALIAIGYVFRNLWPPRTDATSTEPAVMAKTDANATAIKIIVGDQAQKNLGLTAKPLQSSTFWKTITVPGMIVDRPGVSEREVVTPAVGTVSQLWHVPGDTVRPGDVLFTLKLASETLHEAQAGLLKTSQEIRLAKARRDRLAAAGEGIAQARVIEAENEVTRLETAAKAYREQLRLRGFSSTDIAGIEEGKLVTEISIVVPTPAVSNHASTDSVAAASSTPALEQPHAYEVQNLKVEIGEQVQAGQTLCRLSSHKLLAIEGRAFRDETTLLERSVQNAWPVDVDFREEASSDWPAVDQTFLIRYIANMIDPATRTFAFLLPLENQYKTVKHDNGTQILWRFRPGQKVLLRVRTEKLDDVFVLPVDAVVFEGADAFVFAQNVNTFERRSVHVLFRDRDQVVIANDGALPTYVKGKEHWTIHAIARTAAAQLNRMAKASSSAPPTGYHVHADGSLHKNEDEGKQ